MSRTTKGSKGPGWEPWSNRHEREEERLRSLERDALDRPDGAFEICPGCPVCECRYCGGPVAARLVAVENLPALFKCLHCGYAPPEANGELSD